MRTTVFTLLLPLALLAGCTLEVAPEYTRPFIGQVDAASGAWWLPDGEVVETVEVDQGFVIASITPTSGVPEGGDKVVLEGNDFRPTDVVLFGDTEAAEVRFQGPDRLVAFSPTHASGRVPVRVRHQEGAEAVAPRSFLFTREPTLLSVSPASASPGGGEPARLRFDALDDDARVLVGDRLLVAQRRVDAQTIVGVLPPLRDGPNDILVVTPGKTWAFDGAIRAIARPRVDRAEPMVVPPLEGGDVALVGAGLSSEARVFVDGAAAEVLGARADGTRLRVRIPAGPAGSVRIEVVADGGLIVAQGAVVRAQASAPALAGVFPPSGKASGGVALAFAPAGLDAGEIDRVFVCDVEAPILARPPGLVLVSTPPLTAQVCDVRAEAGAQVLTLEAAYEARDDAARVDQIDPAVGPARGGTRIRLVGAFPNGLDEASLCGLPLLDLRADPQGSWSGVTPAGSPGECPMEVSVGGRIVGDGPVFRFAAGRTEVLAVTDDEGSRAGGTLVRVLGTDLPPTASVLFDRRPAVVENAAPHALRVRTPAVDQPRPVDVVVAAGAYAATLPEGYAYLDLATEGTGTWGGPIRGTVNVTVMHSTTREAVPDVLVSLRRDDGAYLRGRTDEKGQVVLSDDGLLGPVTVTGSRPQFSAYTIVDFDARNVTLGLRGPVPPPPTGGGPTPEPLFKPATITGTVHGVDKYVPPPFRACDPEQSDGMCAACAADADCQGIARCTDVGSFGRSCLVPCSPFDEPCPAGFGCYPGASGSQLCYPVLGQRRIYCFVSSDGAGGLPVTVDQGTLVSVDDAFYLSGVRLGELAVICLAGYEDDVTHEFVPQTLGAARHLFTLSDTLLPDVRVFLDTPLAESPAFELTGYVDAPDAFASITAWATLDLGSDGALALPGFARQVDARHVVFPRVPLQFTGTFYDATLDAQVHGDRGGSAYAPYAEAYRFGLAGFRQGRTYAFEGDKPIERPLSSPLNFTCLARDAEGELLSATDDGRVLRQRWGTWYAEPVAGHPVLRALAAAGDHVVGVGDGGVLVARAAGAWSLPVAVTDRNLRGVALDPSGTTLLAVGDQRLIEGPLEGPTASKIPDDLRAVAVASDGSAWSVGLAGVAYRRSGGDWQRFVLDPTDDLLALATVGADLWAGGRRGSLLRVHPDGSFERVVDVGRPIATLVATEQGVVAGTLGGLSIWDGQSLRRIALAPDFLATGVALGPDHPEAVVGAMRLELGPLMPPPTFLRPERDGTWKGRTLAWRFPGGTPPGDYQIVTLFDYYGELAWTVLLGGMPTTQVLAPLDAWGEYDPLDRPAMRLQYARVLAPGFDLNETNGYSGGYRTREAVLYDYFEFLRR